LVANPLYAYDRKVKRMSNAIEIPNGLVDAIRGRRCVLFAGAGVSRGTIQDNGEPKELYLPTWDGLLIELLNRAKALRYIEPGEAGKLQKAVKEGKYLFVAQTVRQVLGARAFGDAFEDIFRSPTLKPTNRHALITRIPFLAVLTTNYDKLLESAYAAQGSIPATYTYRDAPDVIAALSHGKFFILKAHGDIDRKDTIILSEKDYRDVVYREPGYRAALNTIFITKTVLFVGASLSDIDVKLILESVSESFSGSGPTHYALVPWSDAAESEVIHWRDFFGIHLIRYKATKGHPEVDAFLSQLRDAAVPAR
jgi:hypothetical protein